MCVTVVTPLILGMFNLVLQELTQPLPSKGYCHVFSAFSEIQYGVACWCLADVSVLQFESLI
jgi:hypothetical protein